MSEQKIVIANCLDYLRSMSSESVDVCVTSPPYWALRDYGSEPAVWGGSETCIHTWMENVVSARGGVSEFASVGANKDGEANNRGHPTITHFCSKCGAWKGQLGLEPTPYAYIDHLMMIFDEVHRVLKPTGACWVNIGDTYATISGSKGLGDKKLTEGSRIALHNAITLKEGLDDPAFSEKSLMQIPSRFSIAMTDRGWILRNSIIWKKDNAMPSSSKDRFTVDYEMFYFFVKQPKYYFKQQFDKVASKVPVRTYNGLSKWGCDEKESSFRQGMHSGRGEGIVEKRYDLPDMTVFVEYLRKRTNARDIIEGTDIPLTKAEHWFRRDEGGFAYPSLEDWDKVRDKLDDCSEEFKMIDAGVRDVTYETDGIMKNFDGEHRNARCVWSIPTKPSHFTHCAMFPVDLVKRPIDACCPVGGTVLDPFCGSGTVLEYCYDHDINAIGIEINPDFESIIKQRAKYGQTRLEI